MTRAPNLCIFCLKSIPQESYHNSDQNTGKVDKFCVSLSRLLECKNMNKIIAISSSLSVSSFSSCENCETIIAQLSSIYHELKCLELQLFGKLENLEKVMNLADKIC